MGRQRRSPRLARNRRVQRQRAEEWARLSPAARRRILEALYGAPQRPEETQLQLRRRDGGRL